ncbi:uncharacterized protein LOC122852134 [Aphidius gifuensis]|uniref:Odorant-binding protein n=1 Tax=Aphidius gifuensis TaxID=684658 RepID=A0A3S9LWF3_APHGI|nr:uncharacterized protein LOC122852134 [Aphidius gifuensis]AZQ25003.1 odorant-binding protein [Aphidius gifuensis]
MKYLAIVGLIGLIFFVSNGLSQDPDCPVYKLMMASVEKCKGQLSEENAKLMEKNPGVENDEINCFRGCVLVGMGVMKNAKIDIENLKELMKQSKSPTTAEAVVTVARECKKQSEVSNNECEVAGSYTKCVVALKDKAEKAGA